MSSYFLSVTVLKYIPIFSPIASIKSLGIAQVFLFMDTILFYDDHGKPFARSEAEIDFSILQPQLENNTVGFQGQNMPSGVLLLFSCLSIKCAGLGQITVRACKFILSLQRKLSTMYIVAALLIPELLLELPHQFAVKGSAREERYR